MNDIAYRYINKVKKQGKSDRLDRGNFPKGSIIVKENFTNKEKYTPTTVDNEDGPWLTVMWKLRGYCHAGFGGSGPCVGGEWFYYLYRFGVFEQFDEQPAFDKAQAFCVDCHGPVQKAYWLWTLFVDLKNQLPATSTVPSEKAATDNVVEFCKGTPLDATLPGDVAFDPSKLSREQAQLMFDCLSWRTFVALSWPAKLGDRGVPDNQKDINNSTRQRVWESYRTMFETFQPANPDWKLDSVNWNDSVPFAPVCGEENGNKVLRMSAKNRSTPILNETHQAFGNQFNILVDQNGNQLYFDVLINRDEFAFFKQNKYANTSYYDVGEPLEQLSWQSKPLYFPANIRGLLKQGAVEIKAAWRVMCTHDSCVKKKMTYLAITYRTFKYTGIDAHDDRQMCTPAKVGLVGMHIGHKTFWTPQWVWSTFEHVENVPVAGTSGKKGLSMGGAI